MDQRFVNKSPFLRENIADLSSLLELALGSLNKTATSFVGRHLNFINPQPLAAC